MKDKDTEQSVVARKEINKEYTMDVDGEKVFRIKENYKIEIEQIL
jgi:hypothetical protein